MLKRSLWFVSVFVVAYSTYAKQNINIEVKKYQDDDTIVLYANKDMSDIAVSYKSDVLSIVSKQEELEYRILTEGMFKAVAKNIKISNNKKRIDIVVKNQYKYFARSNGEKLISLRFSGHINNHPVVNIAPTTKQELNKNAPPVLLANKSVAPADQFSDKNKKHEDSKLKDVAVVGQAATQATAVDSHAQHVPLEKHSVELPTLKHNEAIPSNSRVMQFNFSTDVGVAIFKKNQHMWIVFDKKSDTQPPKGDGQFFDDFISIPSDDASIFVGKMLVPVDASVRKIDGKYAVVFAQSNADIINTKMNSELPSANAIIVNKLKSLYGIQLQNSNLRGVIYTNDPIAGDKLAIVTSASLCSINKSKSFPSFELIPTIQSVALVIKGDDAKLNRTNDALDIIDESTVHSKLFSEKRFFAVERFNSTLPLKNIVADEKFIETKNHLQLAIILAKSNYEIYEAKFNYAKFLFSSELYQEASGVLDLIPSSERYFMIKHPDVLLLKVIVNTMLKHTEEADNALKDLKLINTNQYISTEAELWRKYNDFFARRNTDTLNVLDHIDSFISEYPDKIYWDIVFAEFSLAALNADKDRLQKLFKKVRNSNDQDVKSTLTYYRGVFYQVSENYDIAAERFKIVKSDIRKNEDIKNFVRSELELIKISRKHNKISLAEAAERLDNLKFLWRGDDIELYVLLAKADAYYDDFQYIKALRSYKYIVDVFPNNKENLNITNKMMRIYHRIFEREDITNKFSDFEIVSLFYEFNDMIPIGVEGDKITLSIAKRLINLDLLDKAEELLQHQVQYRQQKEARVITGDHLAIVYIRNNKPEKAIKIIDETDNDNYDYGQHVTRLRLKATALFNIKKYHEALMALDGDYSQEANIIRKEVYFAMSDWDNYAKLSESDILPLIDSKTSIDKPELAQDALRLAIAYAMLNNKASLKLLNDNLVTSNEVVTNAIKLLAESNNPISIKKALDGAFDINQVENYFKSLSNKMFK